jgi:hypothetical protein
MLMERLVELLARTPVALPPERLAIMLGEHVATINTAALALVDEGLAAETPSRAYVATDATRRAAAGMHDADIQAALDEDTDALVASAGSTMNVDPLEDDLASAIASVLDLARRRIADAERYSINGGTAFPDGTARANRARAAASGHLQEALRLVGGL